jgi:DNA-binding transcriptional LysR family regulator
MEPIRYKELHPGLLRTFCLCADLGSYSAAGRALGVSQPVVWQRIRALERQVRMRLFVRQGRQLLLTADGQLVRKLAQEFLSVWDGFQAALAERRGLARSLVVAGSDVLFGQELAPHLVQFCRLHPTIPLSLRVRHNFEIERLLTEGEIDLAIVPHGALVPSSPDVAMQSLGQRPWYLVTPPDHPLARQRAIRPQDLVRYAWVLSDSKQNYWSREVRAALARCGLLEHLQVVMNVDNSMLACRYVALGLGITATPYVPTDSDGGRLHLRPLAHHFRPDHLMAWWRRGDAVRSDVQTFVRFLRQRLTRRARPRDASTSDRMILSKNHRNPRGQGCEPLP